MSPMLALLLGVSLAAASQADTLAPVERRLTEAVDENLVSSLELLERVVNINSGTLNLEGVRRVADIFGAEPAGRFMA